MGVTHTCNVIVSSPISDDTSAVRSVLECVKGKGKHALAPEYEGSISSTDPSDSLVGSPSAISVHEGRFASSDRDARGSTQLGADPHPQTFGMYRPAALEGSAMQSAKKIDLRAAP